VKPVNLLPESQRRRAPSGGGKSSYLVLGVLGLLLMMTGLYVVTANQVTSRSNEAAVASAEADRLEAQVASLGAFGNFAQVKETRVASVKQMATARFDWERLMLELARVLPAKGWLQTVEASTSGETDTAAAAGTTAVASGGPSAALTGCLPHQPDVADLMLRLRRMHRVEDVSLGESVLEDESNTPSIDTCGSYYKFDIAVTFAPSVVEEAPDGQLRVPASLGGGS
jgi:Tfp pilus assembly protein PilN